MNRRGWDHRRQRALARTEHRRDYADYYGRCLRDQPRTVESHALRDNVGLAESGSDGRTDSAKLTECRVAVIDDFIAPDNVAGYMNARVLPMS
ncbi:hypothetical protein KCP76_04765 [Salmonella enterica subsp. enterica serovar Weltevreden]|nr:hypothetical protein KCP76_04765 [Salmonella enterica subsp. enterica serovar Weltevreden]